MFEWCSDQFGVVLTPGCPSYMVMGGEWHKKVEW
jgi:hypothetical protein